MTPTRDDLAARKQRAESLIDKDTRFYTVADLAQRWHCSVNTVRAIPMSLLPWLNLGNGLTRETRRYHPDDLHAYEATRLQRAG